MENSKFFQKIWRFNAVMIALAGLLAIIALLLGLTLFAYEVWRDRTRDVQVYDVVNTSETQTIEEKLVLGHPEHIRQSNYLQFPLVSQQDYDLSYKGKTATSTRNFLFFNTKNDSSHWLLDSHDYLVTSQTLYVRDGDSDVVTGFLYQVTKADTNGDNRLTRSDRTTIAVSALNGKGYNEIIDNVDQVTNIEQSHDVIYIVYEKGEKRYLAAVEMRQLQLLRTSEIILPELPKNKPEKTI